MYHRDVVSNFWSRFSAIPCDTIDKFISLNALFLNFILKVIFGTFGNLIVFLICQNKRLRGITTFNLLSIISISKTISLYQFNLNHFFEFPLQLKIENFKNFESYCKYIGFFQ